MQSAKASVSFSPEELARLKQLLCQQSGISIPSTAHTNVITTTHAPNTGIFSLTSFNLNQNISSTSEWIVDTGASGHICCSLSLLSQHIQTCQVSVTLPNGLSLPATQTGTVILHNKLQLTRVLFVPGFSFYLLSVSRMTQSMHVFVTFCDQQFLIQDLLSEKMIGSAF
ncbi:hypothetical protein LINPERPRIM_LOCUS20163 [Linum perenne]